MPTLAAAGVDELLQDLPSPRSPTRRFPIDRNHSRTCRRSRRGCGVRLFRSCRASDGTRAKGAHGDEPRARPAEVAWVSGVRNRVWTGLAALYIDKAWGTWGDFVTMLVWAIRRTTVVPILLTSLEEFASGPLPLDRSVTDGTETTT